MKTLFDNLFTITLVAMVLALTSCNTEGPTGPQGTPGPQGPQGTPGEDGEDGTANVIYSEWMDLDWNLSDDPGYKAMLI